MPSANYTVVVTGAASGIGLEVTEALRLDGAVVVGLDANWPETATVKPDYYLSVDVSDPDQVDAAFASLPEDLPPLKGVVLAAGYSKRCPSIDVPYSDWRKMVGVHLDGAFLVARASAKMMKEGGSIVFFSSVAEYFAWPERAAYSASKAAVSALARTLSVEWSSLNIRVNSIALGYVNTPLIAHAKAKGELVIDVASEHALGRMAEIEEIVKPILFLLSKDSSFISGATINIDGGYSIMKNR